MICTALTMIDPILGRILAFYLPPLRPDVYYQVITFGLADLILLSLVLAETDDLRNRWALRAMLKAFILAHILWFTVAQSSGWLPFASWFRSLPLT